MTRPVAVDNNLIYYCPSAFDYFIMSHSFQNLRLKYYQEVDIIDEMTLAKGTKDM